MSNQKNIKNTPSSVVHYTSLEVVRIMFDKALTGTEANVTFHLSNHTMMNDYGEGSIILDRFFTDSHIKQNLKNEWEKYYSNSCPFIFSTSSTDNNTKSKGNISMWKMYGNEFRGAYIRFNFKELKEFCDNNNLDLIQCDYLTTSDVSKIISQLSNPEFKDILEYVCKTKTIEWSYEKEWRIVVKKDVSKGRGVKIKNTDHGLVEYVELDIPIRLIKEICLGPLCNQNDLECLDTLKNQLISIFDDNVNFYIQKSSIKIRY